MSRWTRLAVRVYLLPVTIVGALLAIVFAAAFLAVIAQLLERLLS
jgi:hypothetical protein